jgi:hypothetical protein
VPAVERREERPDGVPELVDPEHDEQHRRDAERDVQVPLVPELGRHPVRVEDRQQRERQERHEQRAERPVQQHEEDRLVEEQHEHRREGQPQDVDLEPLAVRPGVRVVGTLAGHVAHEVGEHERHAVPHAEHGREAGGPEPDEEPDADEVAVALAQHPVETEEPLITGGQRDAGGLDDLDADDHHREHEHARDHVGHRVVDAHDAQELRPVPALLPQPVAVGGERDRPAHAAREGEGGEHSRGALRDQRDETADDVEHVRDGDEREDHDRDEHQADQGGGDLLEDLVAAEPDERERDESRGDRPHPQLAPEQGGQREPGRAHRRGAVHESPDDDVRREVPDGPSAERAPALEDRASRRHRVPAGALHEHDLQDHTEDDRPHERVPVVRSGDERRHHVRRTHARRRDDEPWADHLPLRCRCGRFRHETTPLISL